MNHYTNLRRNFIEKVDAYLEKKKISATRLSRNAMHTSSFVHRLKNGGDITIGSIEKLAKYMKENP